MKAFLVAGFSVVGLLAFAAPAAAQHGGRTSALGGSLAPRGAMSHPLGGFTGAGRGVGVNRGYGGYRSGEYRGLGGYPYGYSYYVPGYFDDFDNDDYWNNNYYPPAAPSAVTSYVPVPTAPQAPQQPVVINQYFGVQPPAPPNSAPQTTGNTQAPGAPLADPQNYYLIAYKNHAVYSALAYWVEDKTLHYVTTQNTHNQASLDLIDLNLTKTLNQSNDVPFSIPGE